jgi:hypothetical protein
MRRSGWLIPVMIVAAMCGIAQAAPPAAPATATDTAALEARLKALEKRVTDLEKQLSAAQAAAAAAPAVRPTAPGAPATAPVPAPPPAPIVELWKEGGAWSKLRRGMTWSQVRTILGSPGSKTTGVFGDVWFYPDSSGGRVVFDRDSRVQSWNSPSGATGGH